MKPLKALSKQLFGAHYKRIVQSFFICAIMFFALHVAEIKLEIASFILFLTAALFSAGIMWQTLGSNSNIESMMGLFLLPFNNRQFVISYVIAFSGFTLITKTALVLAILLALGSWTLPQIFTALLCACNGCVVTAACYIMIKKLHVLPAVLWANGIVLSIFLVRNLLGLLFLTILSLCLAVLYLLSADAYTFYQPASAKAVMKHYGKRGSVLVYLLRYLLTNKNYLANTVGLWVIVCFLPFPLGRLEELNIMPLGFVIACLNTPICILLSCDPSLDQAMRVLPEQAIRFGSIYCIFISCVNVVACSLYLCSWQLQHGGVNDLELLTALLFSVQSAILSVLLELLHPIHNWKIETDLWHHPRKYIVPLLMMILAFFVGTWSPTVWIWLCVLLAECISLLLKSGGNKYEKHRMLP